MLSVSEPSDRNTPLSGTLRRFCRQLPSYPAHAGKQPDHEVTSYCSWWRKGGSASGLPRPVYLGDCETAQLRDRETTLTTTSRQWWRSENSPAFLRTSRGGRGAPGRCAGWE